MSRVAERKARWMGRILQPKMNSKQALTQQVRIVVVIGLSKCAQPSFSNESHLNVGFLAEGMSSLGGMAN